MGIAVQNLRNGLLFHRTAKNVSKLGGKTIHPRYSLSYGSEVMLRQVFQARRLGPYQTLYSSTYTVLKTLNLITMVKVSRPLHRYVSEIVCDRVIGDLPIRVATDTNNQRVLAYYFIHICLPIEDFKNDGYRPARCPRWNMWCTDLRTIDIDPSP